MRGDGRRKGKEGLHRLFFYVYHCYLDISWVASILLLSQFKGWTKFSLSHIFTMTTMTPRRPVNSLFIIFFFSSFSFFFSPSLSNLMANLLRTREISFWLCWPVLFFFIFFLYFLHQWRYSGNQAYYSMWKNSSVQMS